jgi:hypothetical protein
VYNDGLTAGAVPAADVITVPNGTAPTTVYSATLSSAIGGGTGAAANYAALPYWSSINTTAGLFFGTGILTLQQTTNGPVAALGGTFKYYDREESSTTNAVFSPIAGVTYLGEVATLTFGNSPVNASLTNSNVKLNYQFGWATFSPSTSLAGFVPITGYAALTGSNSSVTFGETLPYRW